jgi:hypothetical protein
MVVSAALHPFRPSFPLLRLSIFNSLNLPLSTLLSQSNTLNSIPLIQTLNSQLSSLKLALSLDYLNSNLLPQEG